MDATLTNEGILVLAVLAAVFVGFVRDWASPDVLAMSGAALLLAAGVLTTDGVLGVFSNSGPITIGAMFVLSAALRETGVIEQLGRQIERLAGVPHTSALLVMMLVVLVASAFINNTPVVVILTPVVIALAKAQTSAPSRWLIPLSYASIFGGASTLIGTSTNLLVNGVAVEQGLEPFGMFELTAPGLILGAAGIVYMLVFGRRLLPVRKGFENEIEREAERKRFMTELFVTEDSELTGEPLGSLLDENVELIELIRDGDALPDPTGDLVLEPGDRVILRTSAAEAVDLREEAEPEEETERDEREYRRLARAGFQPLREEETVMRECILGPDSRFEGRKVGTLNLRQLYDVRILAVHRHRQRMRRDFEELQLKVGDTLLLEGPPEGLKELFDSGDVVNLSEPALKRYRREKAPLAILGIVAVMVLAALKVMPIAGLALIASVVAIATGCIRPREAYQAVDWRILFLIFGMLAIGRAMQESGAATFIVQGLAVTVAGLGPYAVLAIVYLASSILTELVTNNAAAIVLAPIAIGLAEQMGVDPRPFAVVVMFAASASFATPLGYQTNTFVFGAGNYRFTDFVKVGLPLNVIVWLLAVLLIPVFWPL